MELLSMHDLTAAAVMLGTQAMALAPDAAKAAAGKLGELAADKAVSYWGKVKSLLGISSDPAPAKLEETVRAAVAADAKRLPQLQQLLEEYQRVSGDTLAGFAGAVGTTTGQTTAGRDVINIQGHQINLGPGTRIGGN